MLCVYRERGGPALKGEKTGCANLHGTDLKLESANKSVRRARAKSYFATVTCSRDSLYVPNFFATTFSVG